MARLAIPYHPVYVHARTETAELASMRVCATRMAGITIQPAIIQRQNRMGWIIVRLTPTHFIRGALSLPKGILACRISVIVGLMKAISSPRAHINASYGMRQNIRWLASGRCRGNDSIKIRTMFRQLRGCTCAGVKLRSALRTIPNAC